MPAKYSLLELDKNIEVLLVEEAFDKKEYDEIYKNVNLHLDSVDEFSLSRFIDGKIVKVMVVSSAKIVNEIMD